MIREFWIAEQVAKAEIVVARCPTAEMTADIFTKPLKWELFAKHRRGLGVIARAEVGESPASWARIFEVAC